MQTFDPSLCLVTDRSFTPADTFLPKLEAALQAGVTWVQYREKTGMSDREVFKLGCQVKALCQRYAVPLIVNDRLDLAMSLDADGIHLGQDDLPLKTARQLWGPDKIYGQSVSTPQQAQQAEFDGADYLGAGALVPTATKIDAKIIGENGLDAILQAAGKPVIVIGGIKTTNVADLINRGCSGAAVVSALWSAQDITAETRHFLKLIRGATPVRKESNP